jgi:hypothetical protein
MKSYSKCFFLVAGFVVLIFITANHTQLLSFRDKQDATDDSVVNTEASPEGSDLYFKNQTSSGRYQGVNYSELSDWKIFVQATVDNYQGEDCINKLYAYSDRHAIDGNFNRVGFINELLKLKGDVYELNFIMCNIYSRVIDIPVTVFLDEISSFKLTNLHKEFFYSAVVTSPVIQDADTDKLKQFLENSPDVILNRYLSSIIKNRLN